MVAGSVRRRPRLVGLAAAVCFVAGAVLVALPDTGPRLFSLSQEHGPSLVDAAGIVLLVAGWLPVPIALWRRRRSLRRPALSAFAAGLGCGLVLASVVGDFGGWWIVGAALLAAAQLWALRA